MRAFTNATNLGVIVAITDAFYLYWGDLCGTINDLSPYGGYFGESMGYSEAHFIIFYKIIFSQKL